MKLSPMIKLGLVVGAVIGLVLFLIVVDLGVNAGRIHYGVSVAGVDLGGLTRLEARRALKPRRDEIHSQVILLTAEGLNVGITAGCDDAEAKAGDNCLGWKPDKETTLRTAYDVGRKDAPFGALGDRVSSWLWGTKVDFSGRFDDELVQERIDEWDERLRALGKPIDRDALEEILERSVAEGDPGPFEFPIEES